MSKNSFFKKIDHAKEKISIGLEKLGLGKQSGFRKERTPKEVLLHWEAIQKYNRAAQRELQNINNKCDPAKGTPWVCLVHMKRSLKSKDDAAQLAASKINFENQIQTWDAISTSLVSNKIMGGPSGYGTLGEIGYVLQVPPQNILSTNETDAWVENHIGREGNNSTGKVINSFALVDHIQKRSKPLPPGFAYASKHKDAGGKIVPAPQLKTFNSLLTPSELLAKTTSDCNEVLVIGRPGVNVYEGMPPTAKVRVSAILLIKKLIPEDNYLKFINLAKSMSAANNNVPILYINDVVSHVNSYDYLASVEGVKTIKYVYDHFLSKPFTMINLPGCLASNWDLFIDTPDGRRVHRPNHGLAHTLRVANAVRVIGDMYNSRLHNDSKIPDIIIRQWQFRALFSVIGRLNDVGSRESEEYQKKMGHKTSMYDEFGKIAIAGKKKYLNKGPLDIFNSPEAVDIKKLPSIQQQKYEDLGEEIYRAAHNIDLMRCYEKSLFRKIIYESRVSSTKCLKDMIGDHLTDLMLKYHREVIKATGDRCMGFDPRANYNLKLFGQCSQDFNYCLQQINNVDKYTYDEGTYYF